MIILGKVLSADDHNNFFKCCQWTTMMICSKVLSADDHNDF